MLTFTDSNRRPGSIKEKSTVAAGSNEKENIKEFTQNRVVAQVALWVQGFKWKCEKKLATDNCKE